MKPRVLAVVQARMGSVRFPGKVLRPMPFGSEKCILDRIVDALLLVKSIDQVVIATSILPENIDIVNWADSRGIAVYSGSEDDVLDRFVKTCEEYSGDFCVRFTADNPFIDIDLVNRFILKSLDAKVDYSFSEDLPHGMNLEMVKVRTLQELNLSLTNEDPEREHVTSAVFSNSKYSSVCIELLDGFKILVRTIRVTVDRPVDYAVCSLVASEVGFPVECQSIVSVFAKNNWLTAVNVL